MFRQHTEILHREIGGPEADPHCNKVKSKIWGAWLHFLDVSVFEISVFL